MIPLPVPHPAHIAVTINNRDTDDPIPLESDICQNVLRGIEESHAVSDDKGIKRVWKASSNLDGLFLGVMRYREGVDSFETASSSSELADSVVPENVTDRASGQGYQWTLSDWGHRKRNNSGSVRVDLASPEDITLDTDSSRVIFSTYGTTV